MLSPNLFSWVRNVRSHNYIHQMKLETRVDPLSGSRFHHINLHKKEVHKEEGPKMDPTSWSATQVDPLTQKIILFFKITRLHLGRKLKTMPLLFSILFIKTLSANRYKCPSFYRNTWKQWVHCSQKYTAKNVAGNRYKCPFCFPNT